MKREQVRRRLAIEPYTQWEEGVESPGSACGPATMAALTEYWNSRQGVQQVRGKKAFGSRAAHINHIYRHHGGRPWGMSVHGFTKGLKAYLAESLPLKDLRGGLSIRTLTDIAQYKAEIDAGRPVALKFDKWFHFRWRGRYAYDYHWVMGIGYETGGSGPVLIVHDNGVRYRDGSFARGQERLIDYESNQEIMTMVAVNIKT
ncbi:C39 family peptidase [Paenibacillus albidus]|uniref:C39 family peptidase n=1 Tax=Paenibacillus albidus TaxID=2041023 RepID=UPI001BEBBE23|nr:C39 family peptidase [Paenibacillus albidus]MBT2289882.1 C39 family peptidase [Paenibacillus albidus]